MTHFLLRPVYAILFVLLLSVTALLAWLAAEASDATGLYRTMLVLLQPAAVGLFGAATQSRWTLPRRSHSAALVGLGLHVLVTAGFAAAVATGWTSGYLFSELALSTGGVDLDLALTLSERDPMVPTALCLVATVIFAVALALRFRRGHSSMPGV